MKAHDCLVAVKHLLLGIFPEEVMTVNMSDGVDNIYKARAAVILHPLNFPGNPIISVVQYFDREQVQVIIGDDESSNVEPEIALEIIGEWVVKNASKLLLAQPKVNKGEDK